MLAKFFDYLHEGDKNSGSVERSVTRYTFVLRYFAGSAQAGFGSIRAGPTDAASRISNRPYPCRNCGRIRTFRRGLIWRDP
jgi:hypothetical protein